MVGHGNGMAVEGSIQYVRCPEGTRSGNEWTLSWIYSCNQRSRAKRVCITVAPLSFHASLMPSVQFRYVLVSSYNDSLIFLFPFFTSRFILNEPLLGSIRPVCFCIPKFWFLLAGKLDVVDRLYLKRALVIARSVRWLCCWQMGTVNIESVLDLCILLQLTSGEHCQHFGYYLSADLKRIAWIFTSSLNL